MESTYTQPPPMAAATAGVVAPQQYKLNREGALWIGGLEPYMDEEFIKKCFTLMGDGDHIISVKVMKNKFTGEPASYGFVNFDSDPAALLAMHKLNGKIMPNTQPPVRFKLNHQSSRLQPGEKDTSVWVGDLTPDVDDLALYKFFAARFNTVRCAKGCVDFVDAAKSIEDPLEPIETNHHVVLDTSGVSKGYGFVRFLDEQEQKTSLTTMNGITGLGGKGLKVSLAVPRAKMEEMRAQAGSAGLKMSASALAAQAAASSSTLDSLPPSALAMMVSSASGNPNAGAAVAAEAASKEYSKYWQQYWQQYAGQYAAWNQYSQQQQQYPQYNAATPNAQYPQPQPPVPVPGATQAAMPAAPVNDDLELVEHTPSSSLDDASQTMEWLDSSEEVYRSIEESQWCFTVLDELVKLDEKRREENNTVAKAAAK